MVQKRQNERRNAPVADPEARRRMAPRGLAVELLLAILMALAVEVLVSQLRLSSPTEVGTPPGQLVARPDGELIPLGSDRAHDTLRLVWTVALTKLKLLARLGVYMASVMTTVRVVVATGMVETGASVKGDKERGQATAELQELQENHTALQEKDTVLEAKAVEATPIAAGMEGGAAAETEARQAKTVALTACRGEASCTREETMVGQAEAVAARQETEEAIATLAEKEKVIDGLIEWKRDASATLARVVQDNAMKIELAENGRGKLVAQIQKQLRKITELEGKVAADKETVHAADIAMEELTKTNASLLIEMGEVQRLTAEANTEREALISALSKANAEVKTLQQQVAAHVEAKRVEAAAAATAEGGTKASATRMPTSAECEGAIRDGNLDVLQRAKMSGQPFDAMRKNRKACSSAAENGHLEVLQWLKASGCPWDESACSSAAKNGHLEILQWLRANHCPWDKWACKLAAKNGHLHVLKWLRANNCVWDKRATCWAAENGHIVVLQWLRANGCPWDKSACSRAAGNAQIEVLRWLRANNCPWDKWACSWAAQSGHLEVLQWLRANGCPWDEFACSWAAHNGHLEVLQWLRVNGCPWNESACLSAANNGHLEVLQWLRANGCPWNEWAYCRAAENGHLEVVQWLRASACPWDKWACSWAAKTGHLVVLQWLRVNGCPWDESACSWAAENGHLGVLQWLRANDCPWDVSACELATEDGHLGVLQWLRANGCPWNRDSCVKAAKHGNRRDLEVWISTN